MQDDAEIIERLIRKFSHDFRSPLASVLSWIRLVRSGKLSAEDQQRALVSIEENVRSSFGLLDAVVHEVRALIQDKEANSAPFDLNQLLNEVIKLVQHDADHKAVRVVRNRNDQAVTVAAVRIAVRAALFNVMIDAIRSAPENSELEIDLTTDPSFASVEIRTVHKDVQTRRFHLSFKRLQA